MSGTVAIFLRLLLLCISAVFRCSVGEDAVPKGHLESLGAWKTGTPIEERSDIPEPLEFYEKYCTVDKGNGIPVVFRGAARHMGAVQRWTTDDYLLQTYPKEKVSGVEYNLKETRAGGNVNNMRTLKDFLKAYNTSDIYMVSKVPRGMAKDIDFLPCMSCGGYLNFLDTHNMWMGRGGSKSVIHYDDQDNINCMLVGQKRFMFFHPKYKKQFEAHPNSKKNRFGWVDADLDRSVKGYGGFMGKIDVDRVDLIKYPGWQDVDWSYVDLQPGDCVYIPYQWYHQVTAQPTRTINIHVWYWRPEKFDTKSCEQHSGSAAPSFSDCTWGYEPPKGGHPHLGSIRKKGPKPTKCKNRKSSSTSKGDASPRTDL